MTVGRLAVCASLVASATGCGSSSAASTEVVVQNYTFPPITTTPGAALKLVDRDLEAHTVTADDGQFRAGPFNDKKSATLIVPTTPGSYKFHCEIHPTMHGTLVVQNH